MSMRVPTKAWVIEDFFWMFAPILLGIFMVPAEPVHLLDSINLYKVSLRYPSAIPNRLKMDLGNVF